jgi:hypothetical protein
MASSISKSAHLDLWFPQVTDANIDIAQCEIGFADVPVRNWSESGGGRWRWRESGRVGELESGE